MKNENPTKPKVVGVGHIKQFYGQDRLPCGFAVVDEYGEVILHSETGLYRNQENREIDS